MSQVGREVKDEQSWGKQSGETRNSAFLAEAPLIAVDTFEYEVTDKGIDKGYRYQHRRREVNRG
jgi:hypothetical protein